MNPSPHYYILCKQPPGSLMQILDTLVDIQNLLDVSGGQVLPVAHEVLVRWRVSVIPGPKALFQGGASVGFKVRLRKTPTSKPTACLEIFRVWHSQAQRTLHSWLHLACASPRISNHKPQAPSIKSDQKGPKGPM